MAKQVIVAGHICLDVIPPFKSEEKVSLLPGSLYHVGPPLMTTGGAVANTGLALHRLGFDTRLVGKIGEDAFGAEIINRLEQEDFSLRSGMIIDPDSVTSYSVVLNPPGSDRIFLHCPGANDTFSTVDIDDSQIENSSFFHLGYPPLMKKMYENNGKELQELFQKMKNNQMTTSLDMALPDPSSEAGQIDWKAFLQETLPFVDIFLPSLEEILFMIDSAMFRLFKEKHQTIVNQKMLSALADKLIELGIAIVVIKLGDSGLYVKTTSDRNRLKLARIGEDSNVINWVGRELIAPCFDVKVKGTTGAGDSTIAGFLGGIIKGLSPEKTAEYACAVGAFCVEEADATSNIPNWESVENRVRNGWSRLEPTVNLECFACRDGNYLGIMDKFYKHDI
jgi:sugar/nucleoside kinase (ribokinase family)